MHADAALVEAIRDRAVPDSTLPGTANLLVMPDLDAANIAFNLLKAAADGLPVGPMLLGMSKPIHVLVPSVTARGIVNLSALAALRGAGAAGRARCVRLPRRCRRAGRSAVACCGSSLAALTLLVLLAALGAFERAQVATHKPLGVWIAAIGGLLLAVLLLLTGRAGIALGALILLGPLVWSWMRAGAPTAPGAAPAGRRTAAPRRAARDDARRRPTRCWGCSRAPARRRSAPRIAG